MNTLTRRQAGRVPLQMRVDFADRLTIWAVWAVIVGGGMLREMLGQTQILSLGFYTLHSIDPGIVLSACAAIAHMLRQRFALRNLSLPIVVIVVLLAINFGRGMARDPAAALLWIRANGAIATILLLAVVMRPTVHVMRAARKSLIVCSLFLCALITLRSLTSPTLFMISDVSSIDSNDGGRAISVFGTFLLALTSGLLVTELLRRPRIYLDWKTNFTFVLPIFIIITKQATAGIAAFVVIGIVVTFQRGRTQRQRLFLVAVLLAVMLVVVLAVLPMLSNNAELAHRADNLGARQAAWNGLTDIWPTLPLGTQLFGYPAGDMPNIYIYVGGHFRTWGASLHSMYYGSLPMMGYTGLMAYVLLLMICTALSIRGMQRKEAPLPAYPFAAAQQRSSCRLPMRFAANVLWDCLSRSGGFGRLMQRL